MPTIAFSLRPAEPEDLSTILGLWTAMMNDHESFDPRISLADGAIASYQAYLGYHLGSSESRVAVAHEQANPTEILGFCLLSIQRNLPMFLPARYGYLSDLVVKMGAKRSGIGRALVEDAKLWLADQGLSSIQLQVYAANESGAQFWNALGFGAYYNRLWLDLDSPPNEDSSVP